MGNTAFAWPQLDISPCSYQLLYRLIMAIFLSTWPQHDITPCSYQCCLIDPTLLDSALFYSPQFVFVAY